MKDFVKKSMLFGVGLAMATKEKIETVVDDMIARGEMSEKEGRETVHALVEKSDEVKKELVEKVEKMVQDTLRRLNVPTGDDFSALERRVEALEAKAAGETTGPVEEGPAPGA